MSLDKQIHYLKLAAKILDQHQVSHLATQSLDDPFNRMDIDIEYKLFQDPPEQDFQNILTQFQQQHSLPPILYFIYRLLGNSKREISIHNCNMFHFQALLDRHQFYLENLQPHILDLGTFYLGMGHIGVITLIKDTGKLFCRHDGGANEFERKDRLKSTLQLKPETIPEKYLFTFENFLENGSNLENFQIYSITE